MKNSITFVILLFLAACTGSNSQHLIQTDRAFSDMSATEGMNKAFIHFAHDSVVLLKDNHAPIKGKNMLEKYYQTPDTGFVLTWDPEKAEVSISGDIAYTYGIYKFQNSDTILLGTYVTIWKKTNEGWRFILDSGNQGIGHK